MSKRNAALASLRLKCFCFFAHDQHDYDFNSKWTLMDRLKFLTNYSRRAAQIIKLCILSKNSKIMKLTENSSLKLCYAQHMHKVAFKIEYTFPAGLFEKYHHLRTLEGKESFNNFSQLFNVKELYADY